MKPLAGKVAVVTGGAGGIGRAYALRLADLGADVAVIDIDLKVAERWGETLTAESVATEIEQRGVRAMEVAADLSKRAETQAAIEQILDTFGTIDILVNNAGGAITPIATSFASNATDEDIDKLIAVNFTSMIYACQAALPSLRANGGIIVNVATIGIDLAPVSGALAIYSSAKAAVLRYTRHLAAEVGPDGVRVNAIAPGIIETARVRSQAAARNLGTTEQASKIPLRRLGTPDDCAGALEFLVTDLSRYVTGECIRVSGGFSLVAAG